MAAFVAVQYNLAPFAREIGVSATHTSLMVSLIAGTMIAAKVAFGYLSDHLPHLLLCSAALTALVLSLLTLSVEPNVWSLTLACGLLGFAAGSFLPMLAAMLAASFHIAAFGRAMGLASPFLTLAGFGALVAGWLFEQLGSYPPVFKFLAVLSALGAIVAAFLTVASRARARLA